MSDSPAPGHQWRIVVDGHPNGGHWIDVADGDFQAIDCVGRLEFRAKPTPAATARVVGAACEDKQMNGILSRLPHDEYINAVHAALTGLGIEPDRYWTETPDGEQLDAVLTFDTNPGIRAEWPDGVFLGWDQRAGWSLVDTSTNRTLFPLGLGAYARPQAVATRTKTILFNAGSTPVDETWDGAAGLEEAVKAWEAAP